MNYVAQRGEGVLKFVTELLHGEGFAPGVT